MPVLPRSLLALRSILSSFKVPDGAIDPRGDWDARYSVWILMPADSGQSPRSAGGLLVKRAADGDDAKLSVSQATRQNDGSLYRVEATIESAADRLATPRQWRWSAGISDASGNFDRLTRHDGQGSFTDGRLVVNQRAQVNVPAQVTSNWSLFDAVRRMPFGEKQVDEFGMLEELQLLKGGQKLRYREGLVVELPTKTLKMHCFEQTGSGILPYHYWLDDESRLLLAVGGLRAFVYDESIRLPGENA